MPRIVVVLGPDEHDALVELSFEELRTPRDQARHILRTELERQGLLELDQAPDHEEDKAE